MDKVINQKEIFSRNLKHYLKLNQKNQSDLSNDLGFPSGTVSDWVTAKKYPRMDKVQKIADYLGIYKSNLTEDMLNQPAVSTSKKIPILGSVIAGIPVEAVEEVIDYEEISESLARTGEFFGLIIKGDSMEPKMEAGDVAIVKQQSSIDNGQFAIALIGEQDATVKQVKKMNNGIMLIALNTKYDPLFYDNEAIETLPVRIIGRVVELRKKM